MRKIILNKCYGGYCPPPKMHKCNFATRECRQCMKWWDAPYEAPKGANDNA